MFGHKQWHQSMITLWKIEIDTKHDSLEKDTSLFNFSYIYIAELITVDMIYQISEALRK